MTLTDFLQPIDLDTHIRMAKADADLIYFGPAGDLPLPEVIEWRNTASSQEQLLRHRGWHNPPSGSSSGR